MPIENEFRDVVSRLNGLCATVEREFSEVKSELRHSERANRSMIAMLIVVTLIACTSLLIAGYAATTANTNRTVVLELVRQLSTNTHVSQETQQLEKP